MLEVALGRCYRVRSSSQEERTSWAAHGYDSAWAAEGVIGIREENCVRDPARIRITNVVLGNTRAAQDSGYEVCNGRLRNVAAEKARAQYKAVVAQLGSVLRAQFQGDSGTEKQKELAAGALRRLAGNADNKVAIVKAGGIAPLVALDWQKEAAAAALWVWRRRSPRSSNSSSSSSSSRSSTD